MFPLLKVLIRVACIATFSFKFTNVQVQKGIHAFLSSSHLKNELHEKGYNYSSILECNYIQGVSNDDLILTQVVVKGGSFVGLGKSQETNIHGVRRHRRRSRSSID